MFKVIAMWQDGRVTYFGTSGDYTEAEILERYEDLCAQKDIAFVNMMKQTEKGRWYVHKYRHEVVAS